MPTEPYDEILKRAHDELTEEERKRLAKALAGSGDNAKAGKPAERTLYDALNQRGLIGTFDGPGDLSTNPKHMEGFGESQYSADTD